MSRTQESGAYLGGIGAMLEVADVCPSCGTVHSDRQFGFHHGGPRECPSVVMGRFPVMSAPQVEEIPEAIPVPVPLVVPAAVTTPREAPRPRETPVSLGSLPVHPKDTNPRMRSAGLLWLPPPDLGEVL
jgi:hypothetical protein